MDRKSNPGSKKPRKGIRKKRKADGKGDGCFFALMCRRKSGGGGKVWEKNVATQQRLNRIQKTGNGSAGTEA